jgi:hypothetical protein
MNNHCLIHIVNTAGLPSAMHDAHAWTTFFNTRYPGSPVYMITNNLTTQLPAIIHTIPDGSNVILVISSHGYHSTESYIVFDGILITSAMFNEWLSEASRRIHLVSFVDTCCSGSMLHFPHLGSFTSIPWELEISACDDAQSDMDDICDKYGFTGGLTAAAMDAFDTLPPGDIFTPDYLQQLYQAICTRLQRLNQTCVLSGQQ